MKRDIRAEIRDTARALFSERGYNGVSMRDIAGALNISVGNLTYHYRRKEDLMTAVVLEMHEEYRPHDVPGTLDQVAALFERLLTSRMKNAYYFLHYTQLSQLSPEIRKIQAEMTHVNHALFTDMLNRLHQADLIASERQPGQYAHLARALMIVCIYWMPHNQLEEMADPQQSFLQCMWSLLLPLLTERGWREMSRDNVQCIMYNVQMGSPDRGKSSNSMDP